MIKMISNSDYKEEDPFEEYKPSKSQIKECECGHKFIVTRENQEKCLNCLKYGKLQN